MSVSVSQGPLIQKVVSIAAAQATGSSAAFTLPIADAYTFYLNVTSAGQTTCDVIFLTSVDKGTTYLRVPWRFAQITTVTGQFIMNVRTGTSSSGPDTTTATGDGAALAATGGALALAAVVDPRYMKLGYTVSGTAPVADLYVAAWDRGTRAID